MFGKKKRDCSEVAKKRLAEAAAALAKQEKEHAKALRQQEKMREALENNHIAELMFEALSGRFDD